MKEKYGNILSPLTFFLDLFHLSFRYELIVRPETARFMEPVCQQGPLIHWCEPLFLYICKLQSPQGLQQLAGGTGGLHLPLQQAEDQQRQETGKEMRPDPVLTAYLDRAGAEIRLHRPETVLDLPSALAHLQDL